MKSKLLDDICELLASYNGRDKVVRLACYSFKLYGSIKGEKPWLTAGSQLSHARMLLRLFDDIPMICHTYSYGLGKDEPYRRDAVLGVLANIVDQVFLPVEKVTWLNEIGIMKLSPMTAERLDTLSTVLWATSLFISFLQSYSLIHRLETVLNTVDRTRTYDPRSYVHLTENKLAIEKVIAGKLCLDILHAVSCLPPGWLWGDKIGPTKVAAIATTSSVIGITLFFVKKRYL